MFSDILLTVDYDHTLTATDATIPEVNLQAIAYFMANGGTFTVNTGRSVPMSRSRLLDVPVNAPLLLYNGSAAYDPATGALSQVQPIGLDVGFLQALQGRFPHLHVEVQAVDAHYLLHEDKGWEAYCAHNRCAWRYADPRQIPGPFIKFAVYGRFHQPTVASMYQGTEAERAELDEAIAWINARHGEKLETLRACTRIVDFHAKGCNKLRSARQLQATLGKRILVCVGDGENDIAMLCGADYAFCPADGTVADRYPNVCKCDDGAVADVIYNYLPKIPELQP